MNDVVASNTNLQLPVIGESFGGGIFAGRFFAGGHPFALVAATKDVGEQQEIAWNKKTRKKVDGATSYCDGLANTDAMAAAGSELAHWARGLTHEGHTDWYLPSRLEALLLFGELRDNTAAGFERDWYWTSTQCAGAAEYAWFQSFDYGTQYYGHKGNKLRARAVRRVPIR